MFWFIEDAPIRRPGTRLIATIPAGYKAKLVHTPSGVECVAISPDGPALILRDREWITLQLAPS